MESQKIKRFKNNNKTMFILISEIHFFRISIGTKFSRDSLFISVFKYHKQNISVTEVF